MKKNVLFVCRHNSARSQRAEAFLDQLGGNRFNADSAGLNPKTILPVAAGVMREIGIEISGCSTKNVYDIHQKSYRYDYVITVCDQNSSKDCPVFKHPCRHLHWTLMKMNIISIN
jgi:arsenate reductase